MFAVETLLKRDFMWVIVVGWAMCSVPVVRSQTTAPDPHVIIRRTIARYGKLMSYEDSGVVRLIPESSVITTSVSLRTRSEDLKEDSVVIFTTYYARPHLFRFDWQSALENSSKKASIWSDGSRVFSWGPPPGSRNG